MKIDDGNIITSFQVPQTYFNSWLQINFVNNAKCELIQVVPFAAFSKQDDSWIM